MSTTMADRLALLAADSTAQATLGFSVGVDGEVSIMNIFSGSSLSELSARTKGMRSTTSSVFPQPLTVSLCRSENKNPTARIFVQRPAREKCTLPKIALWHLLEVSTVVHRSQTVTPSVLPGAAASSALSSASSMSTSLMVTAATPTSSTRISRSRFWRRDGGIVVQYGRMGAEFHAYSKYLLLLQLLNCIYYWVVWTSVCLIPFAQTDVQILNTQIGNRRGAVR